MVLGSFYLLRKGCGMKLRFRMKCARLHLQERSKVKIKAETPAVNEKPRRYCQKRLVNSGQEEGQQCLDLWNRLHCDNSSAQTQETREGVAIKQDTEDLVLTVQTLKFEGNSAERGLAKRPRTCFKYKTFSGANKHRMFVKQAVIENEYCEDERSSQLTYYYLEDYLKYLSHGDKSRPTSGKSSIFKRGLTNNEENNISNVKVYHQTDKKRLINFEPKIKKLSKKNIKNQVKEEIRDTSEITENTKITYQKTAKRKSLTISRNQSPETVHIIRVDVVCNHPSKPTVSDYDDITKSDKYLILGNSPILGKSPKLENLNVKNNHFANKYLLTNSIKSLEEKISGGTKVTLLCKTFKLSDRLPKKFEKSNARQTTNKQKDP